MAVIYKQTVFAFEGFSCLRLKSSVKKSDKRRINICHSLFENAKYTIKFIMKLTAKCRGKWRSNTQINRDQMHKTKCADKKSSFPIIRIV